MKTAEEILGKYIKFPIQEAINSQSTIFVKSALEAIKECASQERESEWIDVKERLPKAKDNRHSDNVLVIKKNGNMAISHYSYVSDKFLCDLAHNKQVTHWLPLPKLPKP